MTRTFEITNYFLKLSIESLRNPEQELLSGMLAGVLPGGAKNIE
jgi:hypothetical protein